MCSQPSGFASQTDRRSLLYPLNHPCRAGDPAKLTTVAAQKGRNTAQRLFPPVSRDPAAKRGTPVIGLTPYSPYIHLELQRPRRIQHGIKLQALLDFGQFPVSAYTRSLLQTQPSMAAAQGNPA
ncbi:Hypothetical predicted protein [Pelobates cultripes]|uniref:Uncharacterized protein n=1 Tax=Pelobates cultripes TaxID=61616 RepID=A0AAD1SI81_PELCU|nr:Hypothetical predicted protein [Pelobates cultripes]